MTPQQKLERLIELAKEAQEIMDSMDWKDAMRVVSIHADKKNSTVLLVDSRDFKTLYRNYAVEDSADGLSQRFYITQDGVEVCTYERKILA